MNSPYVAPVTGSEPCSPVPQVPWTEEQWEWVRQAVATEASRSRVAAKFLQLDGPLPGDTDFIRTDLVYTETTPGDCICPDGIPVEVSTPSRLKIDDVSVLRLWTLQVRLFFRGPQMADPELTSVLAMFRRAANVLSRLEDTLVFNGLPTGVTNSEQMKALPPIWEVLGRRPGDRSSWMLGLLPQSPQDLAAAEPPYPLLDGRYDPPPGCADPSPYRQWVHYNLPHLEQPLQEEASKRRQQIDYAELGNELVGTISEAIGDLEQSGYFGPYALVLGQDLFRAIQTPNPTSLVLPQDRIIPFLGSGGSLVRSTTINSLEGVILALGGDPVELVIAKDASVDFLQITPDPQYVFRLHEKIALRIKNPGAIRGFCPIGSHQAI